LRILFFARGEENLGIEYLSAALKDRGHHTGLIFDPGFDDIFFARSRLWKNLFDLNRVLEATRKFKPDLIAFTAVTLSYGSIKKTAMALKQALGIPSIIGGPHASTAAEEVLNEPCFDMVCIGEGEMAMTELASRMDAGETPTDVAGIWFKRDGEILKNSPRALISDLDALPFPDKEIFHRLRVFRHRLTVMTGRGCPFDCSFCINSFYRDLYGKKESRPRRHSVDRVISEIKYARTRFSIRRIRFYDDIFTTDRKWLEAFTERYPKEIGLPFKCNVSPTTMNADMARLLREAGCTGVSMGIQSGNEYIRKELLDRSTDRRVIEQSSAVIKKSGMRLLTELIFCLPGETPEQMWETAELNQTVKPHNTAAFNFYPFPGARLTRISLESGYLDQDTYRRILRGDDNISTWNRTSLLDQPHSDFANNIKSLIPLFSRLPYFALPFFKRLCGFRLSFFQKFFFFLGYPFFDTTEFWTKLTDYIFLYLFYRRNNSYGTHPVTESKVHAAGNLET